MHSSGRGEESPEAYRGVVLPSAQAQPAPQYGDQVQPANGTPWGAPEPTPASSAPPQPEPADATQMLPPYPAGMPAPGGALPGPVPAIGPVPVDPAPVADATQMLPPYPGSNPLAPPAPQQAAAPGPVPSLPPVPPQAPPQAAPAEATQALPLSIFQEQQQSYESPYDPQSYEQQPSYEQAYPQPPYGQEYGGYQQQSQEPQPQQQGPQHDSDYDHLFRNDVPSPPPLRQRIIQPPSQQQAAQAQHGQPPHGQGAGRPPYGQQGYDPGYAYGEDAGGGRKLSPKVLIGIVVAGCVVAGLVVGGLLNSGGSASADNAGTQNTSPAATASASASGTATSGVDSEAKQQAQALDALLNTSGNSRSSVVNAVESIKNCTDLPGAASALRAAAGQRSGLVTQLGTLSVDKLPGHADLTDALTKAWQASAAADGHYANWADQAQRNPKGCKGGHARGTDETQAGNRESGTATQQKKRAVRLWNSIAEQYGMTKRQYSQL
ncbi:hypothetical protein [Streptomyces sp.]|uniref:hypothetical protein n=1 Tax=Streptomyces sp. TaxID=1931 RepID=UPI002F3F09C4